MKKDSHIKLTSINLELENAVSRTPAGMFYLAGTGPSGKTCRECTFYVNRGYTDSKGSGGGTLKKGLCQKYITYMGGAEKRFPFDTPSCKYFEQNKTPPTIRSV